MQRNDLHKTGWLEIELFDNLTRCKQTTNAIWIVSNVLQYFEPVNCV